MKLKYLFAACVACLGLAVACEDDPQYVMEELQVDKSYVAIPMAGGSDEITVTSGQSWSFDETLIPDWLTVTPTNGSNGETTVTFSAPETKIGRDVELKINVGDKEQYVKVMQGLKVATTSTCAEVISGEDGVLYRVTGTCTGISNTTYGNWFLQDNTGEIYIYGTLDKNGAEKNFTSLGIEVGDIVTVEGPKSTYNGTVELVNVTVINIVKSLLKIDPSDVSLNKTDTSFVVKAAVKSGSTFDWKLNPDNDWLHITSTSTVDDTVFVTVHALANTTTIPRSGAITFSATNGEQTTNQTLTVSQACETPDWTSIKEALKTPFGHVKGTVTAITTRGYVISDDSGSALVYYGSSYDKDYVIGDEVEVVGNISTYHNAAQFSAPLEKDEKLGHNDYTYPEPRLFNTAYANYVLAQVKNKELIDVRYVEAYGTVKVSGKYTNIVLGNVDSKVAQLSPYQPTSNFELNDGDKVKVKGYIVSVSGIYFSIALTELEAWDGGEVTEKPITYYENTFAEDPEWTIDNKSLSEGLKYVWAHDNNYKCMKASAYVGGKKLPAESWLISPEMDAIGEDHIYMTFSHAYRYTNSHDDMTLWAQKDDGDWTQVEIPNYPTGNKWTFVSSGSIDLSAFAGGKFRVAFVYKSSTANACTWEVNNVKIANTQ